MKRVSRIAGMVMALALAACDVPARPVAGPNAEVGTRALISRHGQELVSVITRVQDKLVTTEFQWRGELMASRNLYRGLYPVSGTEYGYQFELDFDDTLLERLFPLKVGNETSFGGNLKLIDKGNAIDVWVHMVVTAERTVDLPTGSYPVFVVEVTSRYGDGSDAKTKLNTLYFSPELSMVLKSVMREDGRQTYWRVVSIDKRGGSVQPTPAQQRNSGTVMI
ncbi:hypothetical protein [Pseudokordiimonas caeni]|uniref:hypothetical protein n=1 Tax=Pseudokordiimonas caeni TaxID=2997908 RepID=UPI002811C267|nr:hypothetical protein [Pseudokordiimonas caeni]